MTAQIPSGAVSWARKVFSSPVWMKSPQHFRLFFWLVGNAAYQNGHLYKGHTLQRGQIITTYTSMIEALSYQHNRKTLKPTIKEIRLMIFWLQSEGMILVKPLIDGTLPNKGRPTDLTRAYVGLLITIVNYDTYQNLESYKGRDKGRPSDELGQTREEGREEKNNIYRENAQIVLAYLNEKTGKRYRNTSPIEARLKDGGSVEECRRIINVKLADTYFQEHSIYYRPETLFKKSHWDGYLNEALPASAGALQKQAAAPLKCPRCGRDLVAKNDFYGAGCVYCERSLVEARA